MINPPSLTAALIPLIPHPLFPQAAVDVIMAEGVRTPDRSLRIRYVMSGALDGIRLAMPALPRRRDGLWRSTCFEAFMFADGISGYFETNFSPSGEWAVYHFDSYRVNMQPTGGGADPCVATARDGDQFMMDVQLDLACLPPTATLHVGLSAVIEAADGTLSYWALTHAPGKPDFHHRNGFTLELAATGPS